MIDVHCHLTYKGLDEIKEKVIEDAKREMDAIITCGYPEDAKKALELNKKHEGFVYVTLGLHPVDIDKMTDREVEDYLDFIRENADGIVGVGEVGLDWHWFPEEEKKDRFRSVFVKTLDLAKELKKPVVLHMRKAIDEGYEIVRGRKAKDVVFHCYSGGLTLAERILRDHNDYYISLSTNIGRSKNTRKLGKRAPLGRLTTETDSPFLSPIPGKVNVPQNVRFVIEKIAEMRGETFEEIDEKLTKTCKKVFRI
jgi:TatD DNase family protein